MEEGFALEQGDGPGLTAAGLRKRGSPRLAYPSTNLGGGRAFARQRPTRRKIIAATTRGAIRPASGNSGAPIVRVEVAVELDTEVVLAVLLEAVLV